MMTIEIDEASGFCFGVTTAIRKAEEELAKGGRLYCLGDIVHNGRECERLRDLGLVTIEHEQIKSVKGSKIMFRAHGEPPTTYAKAEANNLSVIDATCPVVLSLQRRIKQEYTESRGCNTQIAIYGKNGHAEVVGLVGQTEGTAIVIENLDDLDKLDFSKSISLYSQTTMSLEGFRTLVDAIAARMNVHPTDMKNEMSNGKGLTFKFFDTVCRQVANRISDITEFAEKHDVVLFVAGKKSSNGKVLFSQCRKVNENAYLIEKPDEIQASWLQSKSSVGICGATSTPKWLMEQCKDKIKDIASISS